MATDQKRTGVDEDTGEPSQEELEHELRSRQHWKRDDSRELSERDEERPLKP